MFYAKNFITDVQNTWALNTSLNKNKFFNIKFFGIQLFKCKANGSNVEPEINVQKNLNERTGRKDLW